MPGFAGRLTFVYGDQHSLKKRSRICRYRLVFLSKSAHTTVRLAALLSIAGIRVHHASTSADLKCLLDLTGAGVVLIDAGIEDGASILFSLAADFPNVRAILFVPRASQFLPWPRAWKVIAEPVRFFDLLTAIESAHDSHDELTSPARLEVRVETLMMAARQDPRPQNQSSGIQAPVARPLTVRFIRLPVRYTKCQ